MIIYLLKGDTRREALISDYISVIVTERYAEHSDFELKVPDTDFNRALFSVGMFIDFSASSVAFMIERIITKDSIITISGREMSSMLEAIYPWDNSTKIESATYTELASTLLYWSVIGKENVGDRFKNLLSVYNASNIKPEPYYITDSSIYDQYTSILNVELGGFEVTWLYKGEMGYKLQFRSYLGKNRPSISFAPRLGYLTDAETIQDVTDLYNRASVKYEVDGLTKYRDVSISTPKIPLHFNDFLRVRELFVDATDIDREQYESQAAFDWAVKSKALNELMKHSFKYGVSGKLSAEAPYEFKKDYNLGDKVVYNSSGTYAYVYVSEYTWSEDQNGKLEYPTLSIL